MSTTQTLTFDEFVDLVRERLFDADALFTSRMHDFKQELLPEYVDVVPENWWQDAFDELEAQGHLHDQSGGTFGGPFARLSANGKLHVREQRAE